jgi:hypothetical protein
MTFTYIMTFKLRVLSDILNNEDHYLPDVINDKPVNLSIKFIKKIEAIEPHLV